MWSLQVAIVQRLLAVPEVTALVGSRVLDMPKPDTTCPFVSIGASDATWVEHGCYRMQTETVQIDVWSEATDGKRECKIVTDAVANALHLAEIEPATGALALLQVVLVRVMEDPDGRTTHGVVQVTAEVEVAT